MTTVEYGITLPGTGPLATPEALTAVAAAAEAAGFTSLWATDHVALPLRSASRYPYTQDGGMPWNPTIPYLDAFTALTWAGAVTRRVRLGTSILVLPMRPPLLVAKTVATLDYLSGGRMILGVGVGWLAEEFTLLGQPFRDRGRRTVEAIRLMKACWSDDPVSFHGRFYDLPPFAMAPKPAQGARLPVLGGGESDAALRRVAEACDGWHPLGLTPDQVKDGLRRLAGFTARAGRAMADLVLSARTGRTLVLTRDLAARYAEAGVRLIVADVDYRQTTLGAALAQIETLARELRLS
jgi:probable F420-dependent oxidoreductase